MARVPRDSPLLGSLVNFDESSASARTTPNYPDGGGYSFQMTDQSPHHLPASVIRRRENAIRLRRHRTRASCRRRRQIVIGIWVTSHQQPSELLLRIPIVRDGAERCFKRPREVSGCHKRQRFDGFEYQTARALRYSNIESVEQVRADQLLRDFAQVIQEEIWEIWFT